MVKIFLAEGFEIVEALGTYDVLKRAHIDVMTVSISTSLKVKSSCGIEVVADELFDPLEECDVLVLPGGMPGANNLEVCNELCELIRESNDESKIIAAICAGPKVLAKCGVLYGKKATCYPGYEELLGTSYEDKDVLVSENIVTGRSAGYTLDFALQLVSVIKDKEIENKVRQSLFCK